MKLLNSDPEEIQALLDNMAIESKAIFKEVADICWYMRGGVTYDQAMRLTHRERQIMAKLIKDNIERTEKSGMPLL